MKYKIVNSLVPSLSWNRRILWIVFQIFCLNGSMTFAEPPAMNTHRGYERSFANNNPKTFPLTVTNKSPHARFAQTVEINWAAIQKKLKNITPDQVIVRLADTRAETPSQVIYNGKATPQFLIFQTDIPANASRRFLIEKGTPASYTPRTYGRQVPERYDDFAWENDRIAFRMYGAALDARPDNAKGIDLWLKKTSSLVINKWYKTDDYHRDHGEGLDAYSVGFTLGAGNSAPLTDKGLVFSANYSSYKILDQGPLRFSFQLIYQPWMVDGKMVQQMKTISLDAGSNLNKITDVYQFEGSVLTVATGVTKHKDDGHPVIDRENRLVSYWDQADGKVDNGKVGVGVIVPEHETVSFENKMDHLLAIARLKSGEPFVYYQGGAWNRSGYFPDEKAWVDYLKVFSENLKTPLNIH